VSINGYSHAIHRTSTHSGGTAYSSPACQTRPAPSSIALSATPTTPQSRRIAPAPHLTRPQPPAIGLHVHLIIPHAADVPRLLPGRGHGVPLALPPLAREEDEACKVEQEPERGEDAPGNDDAVGDGAGLRVCPLAEAEVDLDDAEDDNEDLGILAWVGRGRKHDLERGNSKGKSKMEGGQQIMDEGL